MSELVKCGCGGEAKLCGAEYFWWVECRKCRIRTIIYETKSEAVEAWNRAMGERKTKVTDKTENVEGHESEFGGKCGECGQWVYDELPFCPHCGKRLDWSNDEI